MSVGPGACSCPRTGVPLEGFGAGFRPPRRNVTRRADRSQLGNGDLWIAGAQLPLFPVRWSEKRQLRCRTPKQLPLHDDLVTAYGRRLTADGPDEVAAGGEVRNAVRAGAKLRDFIAADVQQFASRFSPFAPRISS